MKQLFATVLLVSALSGPAFGQADARSRGTGSDQPAPAQTRRVTGRVVDAAGAPIVGATVAVVERSSGKQLGGTYSDANGNFAVDVDPSRASTIRVTYVGFATKEYPVTDATSTIAATLQEDGPILNTQVITAYGTADKRDLTSSVAVLDGNKIASLPVQSFDAALAGRLPGVYVLQQNGLPNSTNVIRIRGTASISSGSSPLIVLDGVPINSGDNSFFGTGVRSNALGDIPPNDIESITTLKDAAATALYGSRAAAGVIIVTTKRGKAGKATVTYNGQVGFIEAFRQPTLLNAAQFVEIKNEGRRNNLQSEVYVRNPLAASGDNTLYDIDWQKALFRTGFQHNHSFQITGASENGRLSYLLSLNYSVNDGYILNSQFRRSQGRINIDYKVYDWLKVGTNLNVSGTDARNPQVGGDNGVFAGSNIARQVWILYPTIPGKLQNGDFNINPSDGNMNVFGQPNYGLGGGQGNPYYNIEVNRYQNENFRILGQTFAEITVPWVKGLRFKTTYGVDITLAKDYVYVGPRGGDGFSAGGAVDNSFVDSRNWNWNNVLTYNTTIAEDHDLTVLVGHEAQQDEFDQFTAGRRRATDPFFNTAGGGFSDPNVAAGGFARQGIVSVFSKFDYGYKKRYLVSANVRRDGLSLLDKDGRWGNFYSFSGAWTVSEESFFKNISALSVVNYFKLRGSWGKTGNSQIPGGSYASQTTYGAPLYGTLPALAYGTVLDRGIQWETGEKLDLGFELSLFNDRLKIEFDAYNNFNNNLVFSQPQSPSKGFGAINTNIGSLRNSGIEVAVSGDIIRDAAGFTWTSSINLTTQKNRVLSTNLTKDDLLSNSSGALESITIVRVGESIGSFYTTPWLGVNPINGLSMFQGLDGRAVQWSSAPTGVGADGIFRRNGFSYVDDGLAAPNPSANRVISGQALPKWYGGWDNTFSYKGLELTVLVRFSGGNQVYGGSVAQWQDARSLNNYDGVLRRWTTPGQQTDIPRIVIGDNQSNGSAFAISKHVYDADFLRVQQISLGYSFPQSIVGKLKLSSLKVLAQVQNAFIWTNYPGVDPESNIAGDVNTNFGIDRNGLPQARTYTVGLTIGF